MFAFGIWYSISVVDSVFGAPLVDQFTSTDKEHVSPVVSRFTAEIESRLRDTGVF